MEPAVDEKGSRVTVCLPDGRQAGIVGFWFALPWRWRYVFEPLRSLAHLELVQGLATEGEVFVQVRSGEKRVPMTVTALSGRTITMKPAPKVGT